MGDNNAQGDEDTIGVETWDLANGINDVTLFAEVPDHPDYEATPDAVEVVDEDEFEEALAVDESAGECIQIRHSEWQTLFLLDRSIVLEAHFLIVDAVRQDEIVSHKDVKSNN